MARPPWRLLGAAVAAAAATTTTATVSAASVTASAAVISTAAAAGSLSVSWSTAVELTLLCCNGWLSVLRWPPSSDFECCTEEAGLLLHGEALTMRWAGQLPPWVLRLALTTVACGL